MSNNSKTLVGAKLALEVTELAKGDMERLRLEVDVNDVSRSDQAEMFTALVPRSKMPAVSQALRTSLSKSVGGNRKGAAIFYGGRDGVDASQDRGF